MLSKPNRRPQGLSRGNLQRLQKRQTPPPTEGRGSLENQQGRAGITAVIERRVQGGEAGLPILRQR